MPGEVSVQELAEYIRAGNPVYLIDVREDWERKIAHLPDQLHIPLDELPAKVREIAPPKGALVVAYCHRGVRSLHAAAYLEKAGLGKVHSLAGGIGAWSVEIDPALPSY